jgi:hypothetical protein
MDGGRRALFAARPVAPPRFDPMPPLPTKPTPGQAGDFDWLTGEWRIQNRSVVNGEWLEYPGEASVVGILGGICSVEELRIPARNFSGMGLRLLDLENRVWSDHWVNARSGVVTTPGQLGSFENGAGIFLTNDVTDGVPAKCVGVWDNITPRSCRWRQALSRDGGQTWDQNWIMEWSRA